MIDPYGSASRCPLSLSNTHVTIVWGVKFRRKVLLNHRTAYLKLITQDICSAYDWTLEAMGTDQDHVHVNAYAHPKTAPAQLVQILKSKTAKAMFT